ncbi:hypothetical protein Tco_0977430 [Tanacetum coccineum]|uniref:Uncharacterized protein n=1 Tax=Tanacetum coccineum TaxID=301880 RepID=A0ABQ5EK38_9ASTR
MLDVYGKSNEVSRDRFEVYGCWRETNEGDVQCFKVGVRVWEFNSSKSTAWNEFSSTMASLIICLATNQKFNMSKYIFDAMVKLLDRGVKFLILVQASKEVGEDSDHPTDSNQIPIIDQPSTSYQPMQKSKRRQRKEARTKLCGYTTKQLKGKSFEEIQKLFDKEMKRINTFVVMGSEVQESNEKKVECSEEKATGSRKKMLGRKRAGKEQQQESLKKQRMEEEKESEEVDEAELKKLLVIKKDEDIAIDAIPLATKLPVIIDYKLHKEGMLVHYQLIRADGSSKRYSSMIRMLQGIDREDLEALWRIVKAKYGDTRPDNDFERVLQGDLKVMFEPDKRSDVWRILQGYRVTIWKLIDSSGVHFVRRNLKIQKMNVKFRGGLLGLKRIHGFLEVTAAQVHNGNYAKWFGINKWYQSFALRNFDLEDMELESTNSGPTAKLPILKLGEYEMWAIRIKQYFQIQDYALWEVIENGDSWVSVSQTSQENGITVTKMSTPATAKEKICGPHRNEEKLSRIAVSL